MSAGMVFDAYYCIELAGIFIVSITSYLMVYYHCKERKEKMILEVQNKLLKADKQMLVISEQAIEEMRALRHDMKNQLQVMEIMLKEGRYNDLKEYFFSMEKSYTQSTFSGFIDCGNQLVNSIVNMEMLKANSYGISIVSKINIPKALPFDSSDLCRVLVNLLDNAIEGILRAESRDHLVDLKIGKRMDYLYIGVQNEIRDDADREHLLKMNTAKDDVVNHGYGHKIIKRIVEKYNGYVHYTIVEKEFVAEVMLEMKRDNLNEQRT
jgi:sensor histidine kinase regulating citrate/malate metabolism